MTKIIVAKMTAKVDGEQKELIGKREVEVYEGNDQKTLDANVGLTLRIQRVIREKLAEKYGIKKVSSGGVSKDLSDIDEV